MSTESTIVFTKNAAAKVWELIQEGGDLNLKFRAYVTGGGCSGMQYSFAFVETIEDGDIVITQEVGTALIHLLIDPVSFQYLVNAEIDYREDIEGEQFIIRNPNAKTTCGCGSSFST